LATRRTAIQGRGNPTSDRGREGRVCLPRILQHHARRLLPDHDRAQKGTEPIYCRHARTDPRTNETPTINGLRPLFASVPGIWATGDVNGRGAFTHTSYNDYEILAANMFDDDPRRISDRILAYALYVDPPLGRVGMTETEVRKSGRKALIGKMMMTSIGRARERSEAQGFMKILIDAETKKILGATILGIGDDEIIHSILDVMYAGAPYTVIRRAMHIHPTVTELIPTMLGELQPLE